MAEQGGTMKQLQELLQDEGLRLEIQEVRSEREVVRLLNEAGERRGYSFSEDWISGLFVDVKLTRWPPTLTEQELMLIASSFRMQDTPPKLCHTESCGGGHEGCC